MEVLVDRVVADHRTEQRRLVPDRRQAKAIKLPIAREPDAESWLRAARLARLDTPPAPGLHPNLAELYRRKVAALAQALEEPAARDEAIALLRGLVERVDLHPTTEGLDIEVTGAITGTIKLPSPAGGREIDHFVISAKRVAGARSSLPKSAAVGPTPTEA
jgi:hypothetical protein